MKNTIGTVWVAPLAAIAAEMPAAAITVAFRPTVFDRDVAAFDIPGLIQPLANRTHAVRESVRR
jgi:hypothetical protein